jgi:hypothetical protein
VGTPATAIKQKHQPQRLGKVDVCTNRKMANENFISKKLQPHFILSLVNVLNSPIEIYWFLLCIK